MSEKRIFAGFDIPKASTVRWNGKAPVYHCVYKFRQATEAGEEEDGLPDKSLRLFGQDESLPGETADAEADMRLIGRRIALSTKPYGTTGARGMDIPLKEQCWIVLELDRDTNWCFSRKFSAVSTKTIEDDYNDYQEGGVKKRGYNTDLRYVFDNGYVSETSDPSEADVPANVNCRVVFFRVTHRTEHKALRMNFFVELYRRRERLPTDDPNGRPTGKVVDLIPLIIDPQVPDDPPSFP